MGSYLLRRLAQMVPVLFLISLFVFFLVRLVPGSPADALLGFRTTPEAVAKIEEQFDLDKPIYVQYVSFLQNVAQGDLGESARRREPVTDILRERLPKTLFLVAYSMVLAVLISVPLASWAAIKRGRVPDHVIRIFVLLSLAMPSYWIGMMLLQALAVKWQIFPVAGYGEGFFGHLESLFLPAFSLAMVSSSLIIRSLRNSLLETIDSDYVRTARAKGLTGRTVFIWHVMRNSAVSAVTILGVRLSFLVGGTAIIETVFSVPGIGQLIVRSIFDRDYAVIQGATLVFGVMVLVINLVVDVIYVVLDPRVSFE
jgi:peptide/nickel transport system permease protein